MTTGQKTYPAPIEIAPDTFLIHDHDGEGTAPVMVPLNSMVIRAAEPVVVDTGMAENRDQYLATSSARRARGHPVGLHQPRRRRPHRQPQRADGGRAERDGHRELVHVGADGRHPRGAAEPPALDQRRRVVHRGDRTLYAVRPPVFDSPTTRGLFDAKTGFYWASDSFAAPMLDLATNVDQSTPASGTTA